MLSAYSQKVTELEVKLGEHEKSISDLKKILEKQENDKEDPVRSIPKEIQKILLSFQGELKDQSFVVNTVQSKVHSFKDELNSFRQYIYENLAKQSELDIYMDILFDVRTEVDKILGFINSPALQSQNPHSEELAHENGSGEFGINTAEMSPEAVINSTLNPDVEEFVPRFALPSSELSEGNTNDEDGGDSMPPELYLDGIEYFDMEKSDVFSSPEGSPGRYPTDGQHDEKHQVIMLEIQLAEKEQALTKANEKLARLCMGQEESMKKIDWLEHKVRLLKQDKKRRGETIGKLLRCMDDLRNCGKLDFSRATCERAILTSTLSTRGMPHDERIQVAINVTEAEQLHQYCPDANSPRLGSEGPDVTTSGNAENMCEASDTQPSSFDNSLFSVYEPASVDLPYSPQGEM